MLMNETIPIAGTLERIRLIFRRVSSFRIEGDSMSPVLRSGDRVIVDPRARVYPGDLVVARHPYRSSVRILKRLIHFEPDGRVFLSGDNPSESEDSRTFGTVSPGDLIGKVVARLN